MTRWVEPQGAAPRTYLQARRRLFFCLAGFAMVVMASSLVGEEWLAALFFLAAGLALFAVARSSVTISDAGVTIRNPFRRRFVPWTAVVDLELAALPQLRLHSGSSIRLEGVEPFPALFPTKSSLSVLAEFEADLRKNLGQAT